MAKLFLKWIDESTLKLIAEHQNLDFCNGKVGFYKKDSTNSLIDMFKESKIKEVGKIHIMEFYSFIDGKLEGPSDGDYIETLELEQMGERFYVRAYCENEDYYLDLANAAEKRLCLMLTNEFAKGNDYISLSNVCKHENYNAILKAALLLERNGVIKLIQTESGIIYHLEEVFIKDMWLTLFMAKCKTDLVSAKEKFNQLGLNFYSNKELFVACADIVNKNLALTSKENLLRTLPEAAYFLQPDEITHTPIIDIMCQMYEIEMRNGKAFDLQENEEMEPKMNAENLVEWFIESVAEKKFYAFDEGYSYLDELLRELLAMKKCMKLTPTLTEEESKIVKTALHQYGNKCMLNENGEKERERIWKLEEKF